MGIEDDIAAGLSPYRQGEPVPASAPPGSIEDDVALRLAPYSLPKNTPEAAESRRRLGIDQGLQWGSGSQMLDAFLYGGYMPLRAKIESQQTGTSYYDRIEALREAQKIHEWAVGPTQSLLETMVPSGISTAGLMAAGQEGAIAPLAARIASAEPSLGPALSFLGGRAGGALPIRVASQATRGAVEGAVGSALQSPLGEEPLGTQVGTGAALGAVINPATAALMKPLTANVGKVAAANVRNYNEVVPEAPIRAGQTPGASPVVQQLDRLFSGTKNASQRAAFQEALTSRAGLPSKEIDQKWIDAADAKNGAEMNRITGAYSVDARSDPQLVADWSNFHTTQRGALSNDAYDKLLELSGKVKKDLGSGPVPGSVYQGWTKSNGLLSNYAKDPQLRGAILGPGGLREVLDDAWERSIQASGNPADVDAWRQARAQYKVTRTIDDAMDRSTSATGEFNPRRLVASVEFHYGSLTNGRDVGKLATGGQLLYPPEKVPAASSGRGVHIGGPAAAGAIGVGAAAAEHLAERGLTGAAADPASLLPMAAAVGASYAVPKAANALTSSPWYARHMLDVAGGQARPIVLGPRRLLPNLTTIGAGDVANPRR